MCEASSDQLNYISDKFDGKAKEAADQELAKRDSAEIQEANPDALILTPNVTSKTSGSKNIAKVHRAEWEDYLSRFAPIENMLFDKFNDAEGRAEAVEKAGATMATAFDRSKEQTDRDLNRYGLNLSESQQTKRNNELALNKTAAVAGAQNGMRTAKEDQRMGIMAGGLSNVKQQENGG